MKTKRTMAMIVMSMILVGMLSFSVYAATGHANATGTYAAASVNTGSPDIIGRINLYATISNMEDVEREDYSGNTSYQAVSVMASNLFGNTAVQNARAYASYNGDCLAEDYWNYAEHN